MRTYYDTDTGACLGAYNGPDEGNPYAGHPSAEGIRSGHTKMIDGEVLAIPPTAEDLKARVNAARDTKMAAGFDFEFDDARGVHRFGTTPADRAGWNEVKAIADAAMQAGAASTEIAIRTDTGDTTIEAQEWPMIQLAAAQAFQPVWGASWTIKDAIAAGTVTTLEEVEDHEAWPS